MGGGVEFALTGEVTYVKDSGIYSGQDYGQIRLRLKVPAAYAGTTLIKDHGLFFSVRYKSTDLGKPGFEAFRSRLIKGMYVLLRGSLKPRPANDRYPATYFMDCHWRGVIISNTFLPVLNRVTMDVEVGRVEGSNMIVKYSYNTRGNSPTWKEREFAVVTMETTTKGPRDKAYIEARVFGINPNDGSDCVWILADKVY